MAKKIRYYVRGLSAHDNIPTGPFESYAGAVHFLREHSSKEHIDRYFEGSFKKWADFMIREM